MNIIILDISFTKTKWDLEEILSVQYIKLINANLDTLINTWKQFANIMSYDVLLKMFNGII